MSYQKYPLPAGSQSSRQGQYGLSRQESERDSGRAHQPFSPQPSFNPSVASSARHSSSDAKIQPTLSQTDIYRPQQSGALMVERTNEYLDEFVRRNRNNRHQPVERNAYSSNTELDKFWPTSTGVSNPTSTTIQAHQFDVQRGGNSRFDPLSSLSEFERRDDRVTATFEKRCDDERYSPSSVPEESGPPEAGHCSKHLPELAANILLRFGLEREDLQYLLAYPEEQLTFNNLPEILRKIRSQKEKKSKPASPSARELNTTSSFFSGMNKTIGSGGVEPSKDKVPSDPNLVIDYGHTGKYDQVENERLKRFGIDSGEERFSAHTSSKTKVEKSSEKATATQKYTVSNQTPKKVFTPFTIAKKDYEKVPLKAGTSKDFTFQGISDSDSSSKSESPDSEKHRKSDGHRHTDSKHDRRFRDQTKHQRPGQEVSKDKKRDKVLRQMKHRSPEQQSKLLSQLDQVLQQPQTSQLPPAELTPSMLQTSQGWLPPPFPTTKPGSAFPSGPQPLSFPPGLPQPDTHFTNYNQMMIQPPPWQYTARGTAFDGQPTPAMINDYVATTPKMFPHICTLCNVVNFIMRDWLSHQNTSQHLENCKLFRIQFPFWNGQVPPFQSDVGPAAAHATYGAPTPTHAPQPHYQNRWVGSYSHSHIPDPRSRSRSSTPPWYHFNRRKSSSRSRSRSRSPRRHRSTKKKHRHRSRSRSSSSRCERPRTSSHRSRSKSSERQYSSRKSDKKHSSQRRSREAQNITERLTKELMETSEAKSLSSAGMEDMVKTLTPVLMAELSKMKVAPSSSSSMRAYSDEDSEDENPPETTVTLRGVYPIVPYKDLLDALQTVGKTKSLVVYRSQYRAKVIFENDDDAEKLMSLKTLDVEGVLITADKIYYSKTSLKKQKSHDEQPSGETADEAELKKTLQEAQENPTDRKSSSSKSREDKDSPEKNSAEEVHFEQTQESAECCLMDKQKEFTEAIFSSKTSVKKQKSPEEQPSGGTAEGEAQENPADRRSSSSESSEDEDSSADNSAEEVPFEQTQESAEYLEEETKDPEEEPESSSSAGPAQKGLCTDQSSADLEMSLTVGEMLETHLTSKNFRCFMNKEKCFKKTFKKKMLLVSDLPDYEYSSYTEEELAAHLSPYGFQHTSDSIYVIPQTRMAIAQMPSVKDMRNLVSQTFSEGILFKGTTTLTLRPFNNTFYMSPFRFYKSLMALMHFEMSDGGERTVYIHGISPSETKKLREDLRHLLHIRNFLPLMNRLFIEFESVLDADRFGMKLSDQMWVQKYRIYRMKAPSSAAGSSTAPEWRTPPFWMTLRTPPFLYPTVKHSFISPACVLVNQAADITKAAVVGSEFATVMLSGLPEKDYTHDDVAKLVWRFFRTQTLQILNHNLYILPLQRRAFVFFTDWMSCSEFLKQHIRSPVSLKGHTLSVQVVLEKIHPGFTQSNVYESLIKWSSPLKPNPEFLANRLLSVEMTETSPALVMMVMEVVQSIAPFVNFLPLANRIYVEMVNVIGVVDVQLKISSKESSQLPSEWKKVKHIEPMSNLDQRLNCCNHTPLYLKPGPPQKKKKKKKNKSQRNASREAGPVAAGDCNVYIAHNRVPRASAAAARVLIAIKLTEEPLRGSGAAKTETSPNLSEMGPGSQVTHQIQSLETGSTADSAQEEKKGNGEEEEEEETMEGGHEEQKDEDLEENHQNNYSNKYPEGNGLELGLMFRQGPEKPAADEELQQSPRGDEGNGEEICLESLTSKDESLLDSSGAVLEPDTSEPAAPKDDHLVTVTPEEDQPPKGTEVVHPGTMVHDGTDGKDDQPNTSCEMSEERVEPAFIISSSVEHEAAETSSRKRRKNSEDEMPTGGTLPADDTKKPSNTDATAAPENSWTATPEGDRPTAAQKPKRGRPKKSVSAATRSSLKTEDDPREDKEGTAPDEVQTRSSTAKKTLLLEERATEEAAVEVNREEESKLPDFTHPEVRTAADEDEEEDQKTHGDGTDEALKMKEETEEGQNLNVTPRPRGRPRKSLKAPVRRSVRGGPSAPAAGAEEAGQEAVSAASQPQPDGTDARTPGGAETSRTKGGRDPDGPEAKRPRPEPLSSDSRIQLPPFDPSQSIGQEFMELKWVHFCRLCSVFCGSTDADVERHCCSQLHYCNLQKHHQQLQQETQQSDGGEEPAGGKD